MRQIGSHSTVQCSASAIRGERPRLGERRPSVPASRCRCSSKAVSPAIAVTTPGCRSRRPWSSSRRDGLRRRAPQGRSARPRGTSRADASCASRPVPHGTLHARRRRGGRGPRARAPARCEARDRRVSRPGDPLVSRARSARRRCRRAPRRATAVRVAQIANRGEIKRPGDRERRTGCGRSARPPRRPSQRASPSWAACPRRAQTQTPSPPRRARRRASRRSARSRGGSRSRRSRAARPARRAQRLPASSTSTSTGGSASAPRAVSARVLPLVRPGQAARAAGAAGQLRQRSRWESHAPADKRSSSA